MSSPGPAPDVGNAEPLPPQPPSTAEPEVEMKTEETEEKGPANSEYPNGDANNGEVREDGSELQFLPSAASGGPDLGIPGSKNGTIFREKQVKPNKVYIGGLPEHTRNEDLRNCFGKIGHIVNIELKIGYGFVEFESREAAEDSVDKYNEGFFMGNKIRVELSHGGGRTAKYAGEPGSCFKCGEQGHWARECPNHVVPVDQRRRDPPLLDRISSGGGRDYPPPRDYPPYRDGRYSPRHGPMRDGLMRDGPMRDGPMRDGPMRDGPTRDGPTRDGPMRDGPIRDGPIRDGPPPPRDGRYGYDYPPAGRRGHSPPPRGVPPPRDFRRDYPPDFRNYPPPPPPRQDYRPGGFYEPDAYNPRDGPRPPPRDGYDRRGPYPGPPPPIGRPRSPPPRVRSPGFHRDYPPLPVEYRGRPPSPPPGRYADYGPPGRYRRRSQSPPPPLRGGPPPGAGYPKGDGYISGAPPPGADYGYGAGPGPGSSLPPRPGGPLPPLPPRRDDRDFPSMPPPPAANGVYRRP